MIQPAVQELHGEVKPSQLTMNDLISESIETAAVATRASSTTKQVQEVVEVVEVVDVDI